MKDQKADAFRYEKLKQRQTSLQKQGWFEDPISMFGYAYNLGFIDAFNYKKKKVGRKRK